MAASAGSARAMTVCEEAADAASSLHGAWMTESLDEERASVSVLLRISHILVIAMGSVGSARATGVRGEAADAAPSRLGAREKRS